MAKSIQQERRSGKCFVYLLAAFVILCALVLVFASLLRVKNPYLKLRSATSNKISYSTSPSFNATLIIFLALNNPTFGAFTYENNSLSVLYAGLKIAHSQINGGRVSFRQTKEIHVTVKFMSAIDITSGSLNLTTNVFFSGKVHLFKIINIRKTIEMPCSMNLNFTSHATQAIQCQ